MRSSASMNIDNEEGGECEAKNQFFFEARQEFLLLLKKKERSAKIEDRQQKAKATQWKQDRVGKAAAAAKREKLSRYVYCALRCAATVDASFNHHTIHIITSLLLLLLLVTAARNCWLAGSLKRRRVREERKR